MLVIRRCLSWGWDFLLSLDSHLVRGNALEALRGTALGVNLSSCPIYPQSSGGICLQEEGKLQGPGRVGVPRCPADLGVVFQQASVGTWFPHKAIMYWEN